MPVSKGKNTRGVMSAEDAQAAAEASAAKNAVKAKAAKEAEERAAAAKEKLESYQLKKAAEKAKAEREKKERDADVKAKVDAYKASKAPKNYVVKAGDSLSKIAKEQLGDAKRYPEIQKLNNIDNPNSIKVGQELKMPE